MSNNEYIKSVYDKTVKSFHQGSFESVDYQDMKLGTGKTEPPRKRIKPKKNNTSENTSFNSVDLEY